MVVLFNQRRYTEMETLTLEMMVRFPNHEADHDVAHQDCAKPIKGISGNDSGNVLLAACHHLNITFPNHKPTMPKTIMGR
jgi:hypothetical protein